MDPTPRRSIACLADLHVTCARRALSCGCACHGAPAAADPSARALAEAARRASRGGVTYRAERDADGSVTVWRLDAAGGLTAHPFDDPHAALGYLDAEATAGEAARRGRA